MTFVACVVCRVATSTYALCCTARRLAPLLFTSPLRSSSELSSRTRFLAIVDFLVLTLTSCLRTVPSSSTEVSGVERADALALNIGDTVALGVADAELTALARPRVTGMMVRVAQDARGGGRWTSLRGYETRRDKTRLNLVYARV